MKTKKQLNCQKNWSIKKREKIKIAITTKQSIEIMYTHKNIIKF